LREGKFVLLAPDGSGPVADHVVRVAPADGSMPLTLVRPDGHIAARGDSAAVGAALRDVGAAV
jgi:hypothetical protein